MLNLSRRRKALFRIASVFKALAGDLGIDPCDTRYVLQRLHHEGAAFVTKTLPGFSKYALASVEAGCLLDASDFGLTSFAVSRNGSPRFMRGLLMEAIQGNAYALLQIRQFCDYMYKVAFDFDDTVIAAAEQTYVQVDSTLSEFDTRIGTQMRAAMHQIFPSIRALEPHDVLHRETRFGPGAFFGSESIPVRYEVYKKLPTAVIGMTREDLKGYAGCFRAYPSSKEKVTFVKEGRTAALRFVPKDSRGPRVISKEPLHLLAAQMGVESVLKELLTRESKGRINFASQRVNQELARTSSVDRKYATLDLKDASDRVSNALVSYLFGSTPLGSFISRIRSTHVELPSGEIHRLRKFANMGSGLCFPVLSLVVFLAATVATQHTRGGSYKEAAQWVYVYGDDLIVPADCWSGVHRVFEAVGLVVNSSKSYVKGHFRESCGADFLDGVDVRPVRLRLTGAGLQNLSAYRNGVVPVDNDGAILQVERHCRELVDAGLFKTAEYFYSVVERRLGNLPFVARESPALGRYNPSEIIPDVSQKCYIPMATKVRSSDVCGYKGLGRVLRDNPSTQGQQEDWCLTPLRHSVKLKRRVLESAQIGCFGLPDDPRSLFAL